MDKHRLQSLFGVVGGAFFMAGDCLIYCYKGTMGGDIDPLWIDVSMWRFVLSAVFGFIGMVLMIPAYVSFKKMIDDSCGRVLRLFTLFMGIGVVSTGYLHFALGSLLPITYKSIVGLVGILGALAIGMIWKLIFKGTAIEGAYGAWESLGEGLTFLTAFIYWRSGSGSPK